MKKSAKGPVPYAAILKYELATRHRGIASRTRFPLFIQCLRQGMIHVQFDGKSEGCFWRHSRWCDVRGYLEAARPGFNFIGKMT